MIYALLRAGKNAAEFCAMKGLPNAESIQGDIKMNKEAKAKKHILCEKAPIAAMILAAVLAMLISPSGFAFDLCQHIKDHD